MQLDTAKILEPSDGGGDGNRDINMWPTPEALAAPDLGHMGPRLGRPARRRSWGRRGSRMQYLRRRLRPGAGTQTRICSAGGGGVSSRSASGRTGTRSATQSIAEQWGRLVACPVEEESVTAQDEPARPPSLRSSHRVRPLLLGPMPCHGPISQCPPVPGSGGGGGAGVAIMVKYEDKRGG